jgi:hypothetical protein
MAEILRPMSTGELMDRTLVLYKRNFKLFVGIASLGPVTYLLFQLLTIGSASVQAQSANRVNRFGRIAGVWISGKLSSCCRHGHLPGSNCTRSPLHLSQPSIIEAIAR